MRKACASWDKRDSKRRELNVTDGKPIARAVPLMVVIDRVVREGALLLTVVVFAFGICAVGWRWGATGAAIAVAFASWPAMRRGQRETRLAIRLCSSISLAILMAALLWHWPMTLVRIVMTTVVVLYGTKILLAVIASVSSQSNQ